MKIDQIPEPCTFYYEDEKGNVAPFERADSLPAKWHAQHTKGAVVQHNICFGRGGREYDRWPVKVLKWLLRKFPDSWKSSPAMTWSNTTINCAYPIIKYLVEKRSFSFNNACVAAAETCERCLNILLMETSNDQTATPQYLANTNTHCSYCKHIDPEYHWRFITERMYRDWWKKRNVVETWRSFYGCI